jgi:hypothetical protein
MNVALADHLVRSGRWSPPGPDPAHLGALTDRCVGSGGGSGGNGAGGPGPDAGVSPLHFAQEVAFLKEEVFGICAALALGASLLQRLGCPDEAAHLGAVFDLVEGRLA